MSEAPAPRPRVRTFDVFDTLIARRCISPLVVFDIVEQRAGIPGFATARREVERRIWEDRSYVFDDVYAALQDALGLTREQAGRLQELEVEVELEQVIPIAENLAAVQHGDILVSDMYLPADVIRSLVAKAGLDKEVGVVVSSHGKHHGTIWPEILGFTDIVEHLGDNRHGDVDSPAQHGIPTRLTTVAGLNPVERALLDAGLTETARLARELRLGSWSDDERVRGLQEVQASLNLPLLLAASVALARVVRAAGRRTVLMSSRDCNLWTPLFEVVARRLGVECDVRYFYTGRLARVQPSADYLKYAAELIGPDTLVVDLFGTGWSLSLLAEQVGVDQPVLFFLHQGAPDQEYERLRRAASNAVIVSVIPPQAEGFDNAQLEQANMAGYGTALDVRYVAGHPVPVFDAESRPAYQLDAVQAQQAVFHRGVELAERYDLSELSALDDDSLGALIEFLYRHLGQQRQTRAVFAEDFHADEADTRMRLGIDYERIPSYLREAHERRVAGR